MLTGRTFSETLLRMQAPLRSILQSMRRTLQRHGAINPDRLRHVVDERGDHHIAIVLTGEEVDAHELPQQRRAKALVWSAWPNTARRVR
jgi:hypothetical protein